MMTYIIISLALAMTGAIYAQVALVLFRLVPFSRSNWGVMLRPGLNCAGPSFSRTVSGTS